MKCLVSFFVTLALLGLEWASCHVIPANTLPPDSVNLVEFEVRGTIYGRCTFHNEGEEVELTYEDKEGEITAEVKRDSANVEDAVAKVKECRHLASLSPDTSASPKFRSDIPLADGGAGVTTTQVVESNQQIEKRLREFQSELLENQKFVSDLQPKFIGLLGTAASTNNYLITLGSDSYTTKVLGLSLPDSTSNSASLVFLNPFGNTLFGNLGR